MARVHHLFDNDLHDLPDEFGPPSRQGEETNSYTAVYGRMHWDRPAGTITTGFLTPGRGRYIHPTQRRGLTPHEGARIQGFPDTYNFQQKITQRQELISRNGSVMLCRFRLGTQPGWLR